MRRGFALRLPASSIPGRLWRTLMALRVKETYNAGPARRRMPAGGLCPRFAPCLVDEVPGVRERGLYIHVGRI